MLKISDYPREEYLGYWDILVHQHVNERGKRQPDTATLRVMRRDGSLVAETIMAYQTDKDQAAAHKFIAQHMATTKRGEA